MKKQKIVPLIVLSFLFGVPFLVHKLQGINQFNVISKQKDLEWELNNDENWRFELDDAQRTSLPVRLGIGLSFLIKAPRECCSGRYAFSIPFGKRTEIYQNSEQIGIFLPPIGGLKEIKINGKLINYPQLDYSNTGIVLPIDGRVLKSNRFLIEVAIASPPSHAAGFWLKMPIKVDVLPNLIAKRDFILIHQRVLPIFISVVMVFIAGLLVWARIGVPYGTQMSRECILMLLTWALFCISLSGFLRQMFTPLDYLHLPVRTMTSIAMFRFLLLVGHSSKNIIRIGTVFGILLIALQLSTGFVFGADSVSQVCFMAPSSLLVLFASLALMNFGSTLMQRLVFYFSFVSALILCCDTLNLFLKTQGINYPYIYLDRYNTTALILALVVYTIDDLAEKRTIFLKKSTIGEIALQLAHDIRSPLAAIEAAMHYRPDCPGDSSELIQGGVNRIKEIANSLLRKSKMVVTPLEKSVDNAGQEWVQLYPLLNSLLVEKQLEHRSKSQLCIEMNSFDDMSVCCVNFDGVELKRLMSNLINNSVEAIGGSSGRIYLNIRKNKEFVQLLVSDTGKGIPQKILRQLGKRGFTYGKTNGNGLGLYHAMEQVKSWGGKFELSSFEGYGTTVKLDLPYKE